MLFFKCCTVCNGDLALETDDRAASLKCLRCGKVSSVPANTHLFDVMCELQDDVTSLPAGSKQAA